MTHHRLAGALAILVVAVCSVLPTGAAAFSDRDRSTATPTPTPTPTATATPDPSVPPAPPSDVRRHRDGLLRWVDNSDNEDGFELDLIICDESFHFTVGPNTTSFELPPEALSRDRSGVDPLGYPCNYYGYSVRAFNGAGRSEIDGYGIVIDGLPRATATPSIETAPATGGAPPTEGYPSAGLSALSAAGAMLLIVGALARVMGRVNRDK